MRCRAKSQEGKHALFRIVPPETGRFTLGARQPGFDNRRVKMRSSASNTNGISTVRTTPKSQETDHTRTAHPMGRRHVTIDGNEAAASVAYRASEVVAIYPITPSSAMGESADQWAAEGRPNLWGTVPLVQQMQA